MSESYVQINLRHGKEIKAIASYSLTLKKEPYLKRDNLQKIYSLILESIIVEEFPKEKTTCKQVKGAAPQKIDVILDVSKNENELGHIEGMIRNMFSENMQNLYKTYKSS